MKLTEAAQDDVAMVIVRTAVLPVATLVGLVLLAGLSTGCGDRHEPPTVVPSDVHLAAGETPDPPAASVARSGPALSGPAQTAAADQLEAARTVTLYCGLIDKGQFARAAELCARRSLWSRRALAGVSRFRFRSARIYAIPDTRTIVLKTHVRVHAARGCPLPDGLVILFFTLGRAGSTVGRWLITAVATSP